MAHSSLASPNILKFAKRIFRTVSIFPSLFSFKARNAFIFARISLKLFVVFIAVSPEKPARVSFIRLKLVPQIRSAARSLVGSFVAALVAAS